MFERGKKIFDFIERPSTGDVVKIPVKKIVASNYQPRLRFDEPALLELAASIKENGLIQPITVREVGNHYEIIAGERRFRACRLAGFSEVTCYVLSPSDTQAAEMALVENIQREDLSAVEEAKSYVMIMRQTGMTQEQVAAKVGKSQSAIANKIRLLNLPEEIQTAVVEKKISERHARAILQVPEEQQVEVYHHIADQAMNVRQAESYIENLKDPQKTHRKQKTKGFTRNTQIGINSINQCIRMIKKMGIDVDMETEESDSAVRIIVRFPK